MATFTDNSTALRLLLEITCDIINTRDQRLILFERRGGRKKTGISPICRNGYDMHPVYFKIRHQTYIGTLLVFHQLFPSKAYELKH
jgi:hypothetical protein